MPRPPFAHMGPADTYIWSAFLVQNPIYFTQCLYDVRVGHGIVPPPDMEEPYRTMAIELSQRRIDVVAQHDGRPYIIEVKPIPGTVALGQLLTYRCLWVDGHPADHYPELALVCAAVSADEDTVYRAHNIHVFTPDLDTRTLAHLIP